MAAAFSDNAGKGRSSPAGTQKDDSTGIGERLRAARERRGLTLEQVSRETKIPQRHLQAIEQGNLAALPGPFYQRAQTRTYARAVNLDPDALVADLDRKPARSSVAGDHPESPHLDKPARSRAAGALIGLGLVLTVAMLWRALPRDRSFDSHPQFGRDADAIGPIVPPPERATIDAVEVGSSDLGRNGTPSTAADTAVAVDAAPSRATAASAPGGEIPTVVGPADERPPAQSATELTVATEPAGAQVTVDGIGWGVTPVTIRYLPPGTKHIRVSKEGYAATERTVAVLEGRRLRTDIQLGDQR
jgi:transcriptional regulator with XRE-family HTH domain